MQSTLSNLLSPAGQREKMKSQMFCLAPSFHAVATQGRYNLRGTRGQIAQLLQKHTETGPHRGTGDGTTTLDNQINYKHGGVELGSDHREI